MVLTYCRSIQEPDPADDTIIPPSDVIFEVLEKGTKRGGRLLVRSDGFTYGVKVRRDGKEQQFPLAFALMSSRQESDYVKVE